MDEIQHASFMVLASGILVSVIFGFVLQRGRYCMNSAFRDIIFLDDFTMFRSYLLAPLIAIIGANLLEDFGFMARALSLVVLQMTTLARSITTCCSILFSTRLAVEVR
jgi:hypothetical protein